MYTIGVDLGGTNIAIGLCDEKLNIVDKGSVPTIAKRGIDAIMKDMAALAEDIIKRNGLTVDDIDYVGIATPGTANEETGIVEASYNIYMIDYPIADVLKQLLGVKNVYIANDANAAALGEAECGAAKGTKNSIMVTLGTGVGGGIILDGKIYAGAINYGGAELGHTVIDMNGRECNCGRRGCWETYSSASALTKITSEKMNELKEKGISSALFEVAEKAGKVSARTAFDAMRLGDPYGKELVDDYIKHLAAGITNLVNIFQPEVISIGGGVCNEKEYITAPLIEIVRREVYAKNTKRKTEIRIATLKNDAGIIGAACLGKNRS